MLPRQRGNLQRPTALLPLLNWQELSTTLPQDLQQFLKALGQWVSLDSSECGSTAAWFPRLCLPVHTWPHSQQGRSRTLAGAGWQSQSGRSDRRGPARPRPYREDSRELLRCRLSRRKQRAHPNPTKSRFGVSCRLLLFRRSNHPTESPKLQTDPLPSIGEDGPTAFACVIISKTRARFCEDSWAHSITMSRINGINLPGAAALERLPRAVRALLGCGTACVAVAITYSFTPLRAFPLLLAFPTVILSAWFLGMWGGVFCSLTEAVLVNYFLTRTELRFSLGNAPQDLRLAVFLLLSIFLAWTIRRSAQARAQLYILQWQQQANLADIERQLAEERARVSETLRDSSKRLGQLAAIVDSSEDVIISKDLNGIITSWNAAATRVFGYSAAEMVGAPVLKLIPEHLHSDEKTILESIRQGRRIEHFDTVRLTKDGRLLDVSLTISQLKTTSARLSERRRSFVTSQTASEWSNLSCRPKRSPRLAVWPPRSRMRSITRLKR